MITIEHEIRHHGLPFSIVAEEWPEADGAAKAIQCLRNWIEDQTASQASVLHFVIAARQTWGGTALRTVELDEADEALRQARQSGLPAYCEEPPRGRRVALRADAEEVEEL